MIIFGLALPGVTSVPQTVLMKVKAFNNRRKGARAWTIKALWIVFYNGMKPR